MLAISKKLPRLLLLSLLGGMLFSSCLNSGNQKTFTIGFSQCVESDKWRKTMLEGMKRELAFHEHLQFIYKQAEGNSARQIEQVKELLSENIDLLIISPNEAQPLTPIVEEVYNKGIPVIVVDRKIASNFYTAYVGGDNYQVGYMAGEYTASLLKGKGKILEVLGLPGSSPAKERQAGFAKALQNFPDLHIVQEVYGDWVKPKAIEEINRLPLPAKQVDLVFAHNDTMAVGAYEALKKSAVNEKVKIIGIDALPGSGGGIEFVSDRIITASLLYPTGGEEAIQLAMKILNRETFSKENPLQTSVVDSTNVRLMKLQSEKISGQQKDIERQQTMLEESQRVYRNQKTYNNILTLALLGVFILGSMAFYSWRKNRKITKKLRIQNDEISRQRNQLIEYSEKAEMAHQAKLNFFTNISHEFRTPLTLILAPLEELLNNSRTTPATKQTLQLIQKNVIRLLRLVNQLMDFRKIEFRKMQLRATENDLVKFVNEIAASYKLAAQQKQIDFQVFTKERNLNVWFDTTMIDKVIFNLLSNAFKFTNPGGYIFVSLEKNDDSAIIKIEDNGVGMTPDAIEHAFEPFFQGEYENYKGSGLGLALSKELLELHHGTITVKSEKWKGTTFFIRLPLGKEHLQDSEICNEVFSGPFLYDDVKIYTNELTENRLEKEMEIDRPVKKDKSILVIEDNDELRNYLSSKLSESYEVTEAQNGNNALTKAFEAIPDLVICDVVLPGKTGLEITRILKNDVRTSHIPVILLTARNDENQQLEGLRTHADAYVTKPFKLQMLEQTIINLIHNKERTKSHFSGEIMAEEKSQVSKKLDRSFINEFSAIVENNISNDQFGVADICKEMGISRVQLYRKVKALLNCNINDYIVNSRLQKARYYLQHEDLSISEVAFKTGFSSSAYFSTVFKSKFGMSPKAFKEK